MATAESTGNGSDNVSRPNVDAETLAPASNTSLEATTVAADTDATVEPDVTCSNTEPESAPSAEETAPATTATGAAIAQDKKWPGWPGDCVFRLIVPVLKVGSIIGRKGELIKRMCEETRARIRVLEGAVGTSDRIVLISGKEQPEAPLSPAMDAALRVFKRVSGLAEAEGGAKASATAEVAFCSVRLLVASTQAINLIGKQGSLIKSIQESTGASVRVLSGEEVPFYAAADERIVELQGETSKVLKALEAVVGHLRKFLVDHSVLPLFEKSYNPGVSQDRQADVWSDKSLLHSASQTGIATDYRPPAKRHSLLLERETPLDSLVPPSEISIYLHDHALSGGRSSGIGRAGAPVVTQITQTMQIPLSYAEDIIGIGGSNIAFIRRTSGAILTIQESKGLPDEITVEIKGTSLQVQMAQQLIQEAIGHHKEPVTSSYGRLDSGIRSSYSSLGSSSYSSSASLSSQPYGGYGSSGLGGYSSYRL